MVSIYYHNDLLSGIVSYTQLQSSVFLQEILAGVIHNGRDT